MEFYLIHNYCKIYVKPTFIFDEIATIRVGGGGGLDPSQWEFASKYLPAMKWYWTNMLSEYFYWKLILRIYRNWDLKNVE